MLCYVIRVYYFLSAQHRKPLVTVNLIQEPMGLFNISKITVGVCESHNQINLRRKSPFFN